MPFEFRYSPEQTKPNQTIKKKHKKESWKKWEYGRKGYEAYWRLAGEASGVQWSVPETGAKS